MTERLANPIWTALVTEQQHFATRAGDAARFQPEVTALAGVRAPTEAAFAALASLLAPGETIGILSETPLTLPRSLTLVDAARVACMFHTGAPPPPSARHGLVTLGPSDVPEMIALADATRPGPFARRTHELGDFLGIRVGGVLAAMAGQRMRVPGMIEVSAVCTDPAHLGRGHAARLVTAQLAMIRGEGKDAFLHVRSDNARAIALYERLGFATIRTSEYLIVRAS
jgi:predicted GNAT family acetyltransferase